ncbi:MAG: hypothetical protein K8S98_05085 [Planctomycetes bacterium]|nr:hypothetical protein [Planctomycetota bacterium]
MRVTTDCFATLVLLASLAACGSGGLSTPEPPLPPTPASTVLARGDAPPGVRVAIVSVEGASGADGSFRSGDEVRVAFTLAKTNGSPWGLAEMVASSALVSGPSFNYQRVLGEQTDVVARANAHVDGSFGYAFTTQLPSTYLAPYNDTASFGAEAGELAGQALLAGTYTLGLSFVWNYTVDGVVHHDVGEATADFRFGGAPQLLHREVTQQANCDACHTALEAHQGTRRTIAMCVLCHTSGAEDANDPSLAAGTPDVTIDSRVMFHRIHNARHLPSVNGVFVQGNGKLGYGAPSKPYLLADAVNGVRDYSSLGHTLFPGRVIPLPKDLGYSNLSAQDRATEDVLRTGLATCTACHGDPDDTGPLEAPAQGTLVYAQPTRKACAACHDDVDFTRDYDVNGQVMAAQTDDAGCIFCHEATGGAFFSALSVKDGHLHPLLDPAFTGTTFLDFSTFPGLHVDLQSVAEGAGSDGDGVIEAGEKVELAFELRDDAGASFPLNRLDGIDVALSGPSWNSNLLLESSLPPAALSGSSPFTIAAPERVQLEFVGRSTASNGDVFATEKTPHWDVSGGATVVRVRTATGVVGALSADARAPQNFVDLVDATGFARDDFVVLDDGVALREEYFRVQAVDGNRLWFGSPASSAYRASTSVLHGAGATAKRVTLVTKNAGVHYALDAAQGTITELVEFGAGNTVVVDYTTDFVVPDAYPVAENDSPALDESWGEWRGKDLVDGTYRVVLSARCDLDLGIAGEDNFYTFAPPASSLDFRIGSAGALEPYSLIDSGASCLACHKDLVYHGGKWHGFEACLTCHGSAGAEDRPNWVSANAPATTGRTVNFRTLLHEIHRGSELVHANTFTVVGEGTAPYPNDFETKSYAQFLYPALPDRTAQCTKCHGSQNTAWFEPTNRDHPTQQVAPVRAWRAACATCHDSNAAVAHIDANTSPSGAESCEICHGPGESEEVATEHANR